MENNIEISTSNLITKSKAKSYLELMKLRLSFLVVISALLGYLIAADVIIIPQLIMLISGGFLVTGSSNAFNQIIERNLDEMMDRTKSRPIPSHKLTVIEGSIFAFTIGIIGIFLLWKINTTCAVLGVLALFLYVAIYTPLKTKSPIAVFAGAFPGSIPPMLGYVAASGHFGLEPGVLFIVQFFWQYPHFWTIAWKLDDDYKKAGFRLLPSGRKDKKSAFHIMYTQPY